MFDREGERAAKPLTTRQLAWKLGTDMAFQGLTAYGTVYYLMKGSVGWALFELLLVVFWSVMLWRDLHLWKAPRSTRKKASR